MNHITVHQLDLPESFQEDFVRKIFRLTNRSESGLIIAPAGMGKTLILDFLEQKLQNQTVLRLDLNDANIPNLPDLSKHITIIGDNAEALESEKGKEIVQKLKSIREKARPQISIILAAERTVFDLPAFSENSGIRSILMENVLYLPPLNPTDAKSFAKGIAAQLGIKLTAGQLARIVESGYGAPRLIKRLVKIVSAGDNVEEDAKLKFDLETLAKFKTVYPDYPIEIPELTKPKDQISGISFTQTLTKQEAALAKILIEAKGELVDRETMIKAIWPNNRYDTSEHALDQMIHRVKKKFDSATPKCELLTLRGRGAKLNS